MSSLHEQIKNHPRQITIDPKENFVLNIKGKGSRASLLIHVQEFEYHIMTGRSKISLLGLNPDGIDNTAITIQHHK